MSLTKQYSVQAAVDGLGNLGVFDSFSGGGLVADEVKYHPGAMQEVLALGGSAEVDNVVIGRIYLLERDHLQVGGLLTRTGKALFVITKQPLDRDGNAWGAPLIYQGVLTRCTPPEHDSNAAADAAIIELEMSSAKVWVG